MRVFQLAVHVCHNTRSICSQSLLGGLVHAVTQCIEDDLTFCQLAVFHNLTEMLDNLGSHVRKTPANHLLYSEVKHAAVLQHHCFFGSALT